MKRTILLALVALAAAVAVAYAAAPTATVTDVSDSSVTIGTLKCATNYRFAVRTVNANGTTSAAKTINQATDPCPPPPPPVDPPPPPPPPPAGDEPAPIAGQGYHQAFRDDFTTLDRSVWDDHIWYDCCPNPLWQPWQYTDSSGVLHLHTERAFQGSGGSAYPYNTITTQTSGKTWLHGYFEARMKWTGGNGAWPGFWLFSYRHATNDAYPSVNPVCAQNGEPVSHCYSGELDAFEGQGSQPTGFYGTIHRNSCGCYGVGDQQNDNNYDDTGIDLTADFHTYGMLWTSSTVSWYLDGKLLHSAPAYDSLEQPMYLLLQMWSGGWMGDPDSTTPDALETQVDYVSVWQQ
jgi:beta-glucanase (GH16 family)